MDKYIVEINELNQIKIYNKSVSKTIPVFYQPYWPDQTPWSSYEEAQSWADAWIEASTNMDSEYIPGNSPDEPLILKSSIEQVNEAVVEDS